MTGATTGPIRGQLPAAGRAGLPAAAPPRRAGGVSWRVTASILPVADLLAVAAAVAVAGRLSLPVAGYALAALAVLAASGMHRLRICLRVSDQIGRIAVAAAVPLPVLLPWLPAGFAVRLALWSAGCLLVARGLTYSGLRAAHRRGLLTEQTLVVGAGEMGVLIARLLQERSELGLRVLGILDACPPPDEEVPIPLLGSALDLPAMVTAHRASRVIVCFPVDRDRDLVPVLRECRSLPVDISLVPRLQELGVAVPRASLDEVWGIPLIPLRRDSRAGALLKRCIDAAVAGILLCVLLPVLLGLIAVVWLSSGRPAIFRQLRVTRAGRTSSIMKLRTIEEHDDSDVCWQVPEDRYTRFGRALRETHLDELPQLVNVLRGEMSLVGPRPERPYFAERFGAEIPRYADRSRVRAGLTGWAQANGLRGDTSMQDRVRFDNQYIEYWSPWLDVVILLRTLIATLPHRKGCRS